MRTRPVTPYDWGAKLREEPVVAKLTSQGKMIDFSFFDLVDTAADYFTQKKLPFAVSICIRNTRDESFYRDDCNQDKLKLDLTDDQFLKDGLSAQSGTKKAYFQYDARKFAKEILKDTVSIPTLNGGTETGTVDLLIGMIEKQAAIFELPLFYLICTGNSPKGTQYYGKCLYNGIRFTLAENRFRTYSLNMLGMDPVNTFQQYREPLNMTMDDDFDDFDDDIEEDYEE